MARRPRLFILLTSTALVVTVGCGQTRGDVEPYSYQLVDATTLQGSLPTCNGSPGLEELQETSDEVRLRIVADRPGNDAEQCSESLQVTLVEPLGTRVVVDLVSTEPLPRR